MSPDSFFLVVTNLFLLSPVLVPSVLPPVACVAIIWVTYCPRSLCFLRCCALVTSEFYTVSVSFFVYGPGAYLDNYQTGKPEYRHVTTRNSSLLTCCSLKGNSLFSRLSPKFVVSCSNFPRNPEKFHFKDCDIIFAEVLGEA